MAIFSQNLRSQKPLHIPLILGTPRSSRTSEPVARFMLAALRKRALITTELIDVKDFDFPHDEYGTVLRNRYSSYLQAIQRADGLIIVTPEYNHGYPGALKTLLDVLYPEYKHKAVGVVGVSSGPWGGVRVVENLTPILKELGLVVSQLALNINRAEVTFKADGTPTDEAYHKRADKFLDELSWLAETLRWGRNNL